MREAIEQRNWSEAVTQMPIVAGALSRLADQIDKATALLATVPTDTTVGNGPTTNTRLGD